jgi:hypothetical protein
MAYPEVRYVSKVGRDAWLRIRLDSGGEISLPWYLKVKVTGRTSNRDTFEILEGPYKGQKGSVSAKSPTESYLVTGLSHQPGGKVKFSLGAQKLWFGTKGPISAFSGAFSEPGHVYTKVPIGTYKLAIPDAPHAATRDAYYAYTDYHKTWFRIGIDLSGSRYLHVGEISEGCVTVRAFQFDPAAAAPGGFTDLPGLPQGAVGLPYPASPASVGRWNDVYEYLIAARADDQSVGALEVVA